MIQIAPQMRILLAVEPVDFRWGIGGSAKACREVFQADPFGGFVFVFRNKRGSASKFWPTTARGFGFARNGSAGDGFAGGLTTAYVYL